MELGSIFIGKENTDFYLVKEFSLETKNLKKYLENTENTSFFEEIYKESNFNCENFGIENLEKSQEKEFKISLSLSKIHNNNLLSNDFTLKEEKQNINNSIKKVLKEDKKYIKKISKQQKLQLPYLTNKTLYKYLNNFNLSLVEEVNSYRETLKNKL